MYVINCVHLQFFLSWKIGFFALEEHWSAQQTYKGLNFLNVLEGLGWKPPSKIIQTNSSAMDRRIFHQVRLLMWLVLAMEMLMNVIYEVCVQTLFSDKNNIEKSCIKQQINKILLAVLATPLVLICILDINWSLNFTKALRSEKKIFLSFTN